MGMACSMEGVARRTLQSFGILIGTGIAFVPISGPFQVS